MAINPMKIFEANYAILAGKMQVAVQAGLKKGLTTNAAVSAALISTGYEKQVEKLTLDVMTATVTKNGVSIIDNRGIRNWWLNKHWTGQKLNLSQIIRSNDVKNQIVSVVSGQLKAGSAWTKVAKSITDKELVAGDISKKMTRIVQLARKNAMSGTIPKLRTAQRQVERLASMGASPSRLKKAYQNIVNQVAKGNVQALDKAVTRAVKAKARYNAERIARTEMSRANAKAQTAIMDADEDVIGYRSNLSSAHDIVDICDYHAEADLYDLGPGVVPKDIELEIPYHPNCLCFSTPVYRLPGKAGKKQESLLKRVEKKMARDKLVKGQGKKFLAKEPQIKKTVKVPPVPKKVIEAQQIPKKFIKPTPVILPPATTTAGAEAQAVHSGVAGTVNYTGMPVEYANKINTKLAQLQKETGFKAFRSIDSSYSGGGVMAANFEELVLDKKYFNTVRMKKFYNEGITEYKTDTSGLLKKAKIELKKEHTPYWSDVKEGALYDTKFTRYNAVKNEELLLDSLIRHEVGHTVSDQVFGLSNGLVASPISKNWKEMKKEWFGIAKKAEESGDIFKISKYATASPAELFSESFVMYEYEKELLPKYIIEFIERTLNEYSHAM